MSDYLNKKAVKALVHEQGKRCSDDFIAVLDAFVARKVRAACAAHNGGKKTIDASVAGFVGILPEVVR